MRGVHPVVQPDGILTPDAVARSAIPHFRVGLTPNYKPTREDAAELLRRFGMNYEDPINPGSGEDECQPGDGEDNLLPLDSELDADDEQSGARGSIATHGFRPFSLSSSLESLLNEHFLSLLQLRIKYNLGWAGAEYLRWEIETTQRPATDILHDKAEVRSQFNTVFLDCQLIINSRRY